MINGWQYTTNLRVREFVEMIQDYGLFGLGLNTIENDCFYKNYKEQVISLKQDIVGQSDTN